MKHILTVEVEALDAYYNLMKTIEANSDINVLKVEMRMDNQQEGRFQHPMGSMDKLFKDEHSGSPEVLMTVTQVEDWLVGKGFSKKSLPTLTSALSRAGHFVQRFGPNLKVVWKPEEAPVG